MTIDLDRLRDAKTVLLNLFPEATYEAVLDRIDRIGSSTVWVGRIPGREASSVTLSVENETVNGRIALGPRLYIVRVVKDSVHAILQIDPAKFPPEMAPALK